MIKLEDKPEPGFLVAPGSYDKWAETHLTIAETHDAKCRALHARIGKGITQEEMDDLDREVEDLSRNIGAAILFAALEVEATLNFQGVVRLGQRYFDENLERSRPAQKLAGILAITTRQMLQDKDEIIKVVIRVFEARNKIAHPKTKSYDGSKPIPNDDPTIATARQSVADMKRFLDLFRGLVPWNFHATLRDRDEDEPDEHAS
jgi:hypothetical protein